VKQENASTEFVDFLSYDGIQPKKMSAKGNVIKRALIVSQGVQRIDVVEGEQREPSVLIHRHEHEVSGIDVVCVCGRTTSIQFEYEGQ
jgi:hypothetical protein